jgi:hypothetical protein
LTIKYWEDGINEKISLQQTSIPYTIWIEWVLVNSVALSIGYAVAEVMIQRMDDPGGVLIGSVVGASVGAMQWLVVWKRIPYSLLWIISCIAGWSVGLSITWGIQEFFYNSLAGLHAFERDGSIIMGITVGLFFGNVQWIILRQHFHRAGWWILANLVGWGISIIVGVMAIDWLDLDFDLEYSTFLMIEQGIEGIIAGGILGAITGGVLIWLLGTNLILGEKEWKIIKPFSENDKSVGCVAVALLVIMLACSFLCSGVETTY